MKEDNAYILGTDADELNRLKLQHEVWLTEAEIGWNLAEFKSGQVILDLGCGPGYCTEALAHIVGETGKVIGVDKSNSFIENLRWIKRSKDLSIEPNLTDFNSLLLDNDSLDGMYCRWALGWVSNPKEILAKVKNALKPGGKMVIQEYFNWSTHQTKPEMPALKKAINTALKSFQQSEFEINVGSFIPQYIDSLGMRIENLRLIPKLVTPGSRSWEWPKTFYYSYFPRLLEMGYLDDQDVEDAINDLEKIEIHPYSTICCPMVVEIIAEK